MPKLTQHAILRSFLALATAGALASCSSSGGGGAGAGGGAATGGAAGSGGGAATGGSAGGGGTTSKVDCAAYCNLFATAACPGDSLADCTNDCAKFPGACAQAVDALVSCVQGGVSVSCGPDDKAQIVGCFDETDAVGGCRICVPKPTDSDCRKCTRESCCTEETNRATHPDAVKWTGCVTGCGDDACVNACKQQFPDYAAIIAAFDTCEQTKCGAMCATP